MATAPTAAALMVFQAVSVASVEHSTTLASMVAGGVLRRAVPTVPGAATWITRTAV